jgi:NAD/NADP transhydrogenase alpha subunit
MGGTEQQLGEFVTRAELAGRLEPLAEIRGMLRDDMRRLHEGQAGISAQVTEMEERITSRQDAANHRTEKAEEAVRSVQETVTHIDLHGCSNLVPHKAALGALEAAGLTQTAGGWKPTRKQVGIGAGLAASGAIVVKLIELAQSWIAHLSAVAK